MEFHDDFDSRLAAAVRPMVTDTVPVEAVLAGDRLERRGGVSLAPVAAVAAVVLVGAAAVAVPRLAGPASVVQPSAAATVDEASLAAVPHVRTADGIALVERSGGSVRLVLVRDDGKRVVLASKVEAAPAQNSSFVSGTIVECPAAAGFSQHYYDFGQANNRPANSAVTLEGVTGAGAYRNGLYLAAITSDPTVGDWMVWVGAKGGVGTGAASNSFAKLQLPGYGAVSDAGCYYNPK
jgi:hypothetical protein